MHALRFLSIFAAAIAAWMVFMWFTLAAVSASEERPRERTRVPAEPASAVDEPTLMIAAGALGARWILDVDERRTRQGGAA